MNPTTTYERIADVIRYLDTAQADQPDLNSLARRAGLSPFHLHRLFSDWAAITPKDFLQCLTLNHAKKLLQKGTNVLETSLKVGMSGPGRLHDLTVTLEAASPGEIKSGGQGWTITAGYADSPFGRCLIAEGPRGICHLAFISPGQVKAAMRELQKEWPKARIRRQDSAAKDVAQKIFLRSSRSSTPLKAFVKGTPFQVKVWRALLKIKPGTVTSYGRLAAALKKPSASRAVGTAVGQNSLAYLVPCHRVIRETGVLGQYRWGAQRKQAMVAWETANAK